MENKQYYIDIISGLAAKTINRLWITIILLVVLLFGSNAAWLWYESQYVEESTVVEQAVDTGDGNAIIAGIGDIHYGEDKAESDENNTNP